MPSSSLTARPAGTLFVRATTYITILSIFTVASRVVDPAYVLTKSTIFEFEKQRILPKTKVVQFFISATMLSATHILSIIKRFCTWDIL